MKYIIFDFGYVLAYPALKHWFITPNFYRYVEKNNFDFIKFNEFIKSNGEIISRKMNTLEEEYEAFTELYSLYFGPKIGEKLAYDFTYNNKKYLIYYDVIETLKILNKKYTLIMLSDNWPCVYKILELNNMTKYFDSIYISSEYNCKKEDGIFFDYVINDYNIKDGEALFIDDTVKLLDIANSKGLKTILMDRYDKKEYENKVLDLKSLINKIN